MNHRSPIRLCTLLALLFVAACTSATPEPTSTPTATSTPTNTLIPTDTLTATFTNTATATATPSKTPTPSDTATPSATDTPAASPTPRVSNTPRPTNTSTQPPAPPLLDQLFITRQHVDNIGGAMDRIYLEGHPESCGPLLDDYFEVFLAPEYDVSGQPQNVQGAYGLYREAINIIIDKISKIAEICLTGGGVLGELDFNISRTSINEASGRLGTAIGMLQK